MKKVDEVTLFIIAVLIIFGLSFGAAFILSSCGCIK